MTYLPESTLPDRPGRTRRLVRLQVRRTRRRLRDFRSNLRTRLRWAGPFGLGILAALIAIAGYSNMNPGPRPITPADVNRSVATALASLTPPPPDARLVYAAVAPAVVVIETTGGSSAGPTGAPGLPASSTPAPNTTPAPDATAAPDATPAPHSGLGSGVVIDAAGDILTCLHVVSGADAIQVTFADGSKSSATIQATDDANDIAVIRPDNLPASLTPAVLGNPRSLRIGDEAFVIGNPFGLTGSISAGVVSGLNRTFQLPNDGPTLTGLIQIDAAVNPGNSGGPLVNANGQVVGIVDGLVNPTSSAVFIGIGLAVPIDVAGGAAGLPPD